MSGAMSRDEKLVQEMNIPCSVEEIISKPMEEFNDLLSRHSVSEEVINVCRDIRRRGKNKVCCGNKFPHFGQRTNLILSRLQRRIVEKGKLNRFTAWKKS